MGRLNIINTCNVSNLEDLFTAAIMLEPHRTILNSIGNTTLLGLRHIVSDNGTRILLKLESANPTGSMKDRMALAMIEAAEKDGRLRTGGSVVEYTGGSTGVSCLCGTT